MKKFKVTIAGQAHAVVGNTQQHAIRNAYYKMPNLKSGESQTITIERVPFTKADRAARPRKYSRPEPRPLQVGDLVWKDNERVRVLAIEGEHALMRPVADEPHADDVLADENGVVVAVIKKVTFCPDRMTLAPTGGREPPQHFVAVSTSTSTSTGHGHGSRRTRS